jgi:hypothetical protein
MRYVRITLGVLVWSLLGWMLWKSAVESRAVSGEGRSPVRDLLDFAGGKAVAAMIESASAIDVEVGDPIFFVEGGLARRIGEVRSLRDSISGQPVRRDFATSAEVR